MRGFYRFSQDDWCVETENIITDAGKNLIGKYLAGLIPSYAGAIAVGSSDIPATADDTSLGYEFARVPILVRNVTGPLNEIYQVSFKGTIPVQVDGVIAESAIISQTFNRYSGSYGDRLLAKFGSNENWVVTSSTGMTSEVEEIGYETSASVRVGAEGIRVYSAAGGTHNLTLESTVVQGDFSGYSSDDQFAVAVSGKIITSGTTITVRFHTDASSYFQGVVTPATNATDAWIYQVLRINKSQFTQTGSPDWSEITKAVVVVSTGSTTTNLILDGISALDTDYINPDYAMTSRATVSTPIIKTSGKSMDVEYFLEFKL